MTKQLLSSLIILTLLSACSRPVARFSADNDLETGKPVRFVSDSENAESYKWYIDDEEVASNEDLEYLFLGSGRHNIRLEARKGTSSHSIEKEVLVSASDECRYLIRTNMGDMLIALYEETPRHLKNFVELVEKGFYTDRIFHRVIEGFMIQGGSAQGTSFAGRKEIRQEILTDFVHHKGAVAAARMPDDINPEKESSGTQFYIVHGRQVNESTLLDYASEKLIDYSDEQIEKYLANGGTPQLDGEYTIFAYLLDGYDTLDKIAAVDTDKNDKPLADVIILEIIEIN